MMFGRRNVRKRLLFLLCVTGSLLFFALYKFEDNSYRSSVAHQDESFDESLFKENAVGCKRPELDPFDNSVRKFIKKETPIKCSQEQDWVIVSHGVAKLSERFRHSKTVRCSLTYVLRLDDDLNMRGKTVALSVDNPEVNLEDDFFWIKCNDGDKVWENFMSGIHKIKEAVQRAETINKDSSKLKLNVLMFGYDSVSKANFIRQMPNSYKYLTDTINAVVLESYNIVGDGTPQALIPILTGFAEPELPETRKRMWGAVHCNVYPFIWKNYSENGYVTAWMEDDGESATFSYRLKGFKEKPTDHYGRPFSLEVVRERNKHNKYCLGSQTRHKLMLNWIRDFFHVYNDLPKFVFGFHGEYSHNSFNLLQVADEEFKHWLSQLQTDGVLDNTILIVMSDHGNRFAEIRETQQGKLEERLPFFSFVLPKWFKNKFPNAYSNLQRNAKHRLMTPFDIHATFKTILEYFNHGNDVQSDKKFENSSITHRSLSLFDEIPQFRDCSMADIEAHWCTCLAWKSVDVNDETVIKAANTAVEYLNFLTSHVRNLCAEVKLEKITRAEDAQPNKNLLAFKKSKDRDGFEADLTDDTKASHVLYQLQFITSPNNAIFEMSVGYNTLLKSFKISESQISRVNKYGDEPHCIYHTHQDLRKYCFCKHQA